MTQLLSLLGGIHGTGNSNTISNGAVPSSATCGHSLTLPNIGIMRPQASAVITRVLETFLITAGTDSLHLMVQSGIVHRLAQGLITKHDHTLAQAAFLGVLSRAATLVDPNTFAHQVVGSFDMFTLLVTMWLDLWDHICHPVHRKLSAVALTRLTPLVPAILPQVAAIWTDVLHEVHESEEGDAGLYWRMEAADLGALDGGVADDDGIPEICRRRTILKRDTVHTVSLVAVIKDTLTILASQMGGTISAVIGMLDPDLITQLEPLLK